MDYRTSDFPLICALASLGHGVKQVEITDTGRAYFYFDGEAEKLATKYWANELLVEPRKYHAMETSIRDRIVNEKANRLETNGK